MIKMKVNVFESTVLTLARGIVQSFSACDTLVGALDSFSIIKMRQTAATCNSFSWAPGALFLHF